MLQQWRQISWRRCSIAASIVLETKKEIQIREGRKEKTSPGDRHIFLALTVNWQVGERANLVVRTA